ncbi:hypothetical protein BJF83_15620 [Nocardiopsis sp. CNR-923]|nr:hypothetical protein BJF83_15620 [Nocardiopsis sp. CNR-923]
MVGLDVDRGAAHADGGGRGDPVQAERVGQPDSGPARTQRAQRALQVVASDAVDDRVDVADGPGAVDAPTPA